MIDDDTTATATTTRITTTTTIDANNTGPKLIALGFCGVDDSIHPNQLAILSYTYPHIEFGVLFRPDKEGTPRYASPQWIQQLQATVQHMKQQTKSSGGHHVMKLAAHLCGIRVNELLFGGDMTFVNYLVHSIGFQRIQINATAVNGVDTLISLTSAVPTVWKLIVKYPNIEFIIQKNNETKPLWEPLEELLLLKHPTVTNISMLLDESKGTGTTTSTSLWPSIPSTLYRTGYAGGIGPNNVQAVCTDIIHRINTTATTTTRSSTVQDNNNQRHFWIDMESSLRSIKNGNDVFDLDTCYAVIHTVCSMQLMQHPQYLPSS